ncbi:Hypothetical_protein [Hexamita inflata]|uniref:Hypothetical_protein n=2 Tax=Hexamita inflata TaxID=28002 RepID=A0AA86U7C7_9EUKA|nr:Hypothetical protein HINF_LOCUS29641 [Hexamita inflata]
MFIYADTTQQSKLQLQMQQVSQFSVFGFNTLQQDIIDSEIFVTINYSILTGALICLQCDIDIKRSQLEFIAHGISISALVQQSLNIIQISEVSISFRFWSNYSSGIINQVKQALSLFSISQSILTGFNYINSDSNGYMCSALYKDIQIEITTLSVCVENTLKIGVSSFTAILTQLEYIQCENSCKIPNQYVTYGICQQQLKFSSLLQNQTVVCEYPFIFQNDVCECDFGFFLNDSICVNVIQQFDIVIKNVEILENQFKIDITRTELELKTAFIGLEELILNNIFDQTQNMNENSNLVNESIISTNNSIHKNINDLRTDNSNILGTIFQLIQETHAQNINQIDTKFNVQSTSINEYQIQIKNNFTAQKDQMTDLKNTISTRFTTLDTSVINFNTKLNDLKIQLTGSQTSIESKISSISTQINSVATTNQLTAIQQYMTNTLATQTYLKAVYDSLVTYIAAASLDPCKQWPGSINQGGLCKCAYLYDEVSTHSVFCINLNKCCFTLTSNDNNTYQCPGYTGFQTCIGMRVYANDVQ